MFCLLSQNCQNFFVKKLYLKQKLLSENSKNGIKSLVDPVDLEKKNKICKILF